MEQTIKNLRNNGFEVLLASDKKEALEIAKRFVGKGMTVGLGGSTTVVEIGLLDWLAKNSGIKLYNQYEPGITMEENYNRRRLGILSDLYITGCNAITTKGELVNTDGDGNRVAAQIFGPEKVLIIAGKNKIVKDIQEGFDRIKKISIPKNIERMNNKAISLSKEPKYNQDNIANKFSYITSDKPGRTTIILVDEKLGF